MSKNFTTVFYKDELCNEFGFDTIYLIVIQLIEFVFKTLIFINLFESEAECCLNIHGRYLNENETRLISYIYRIA